MELKGTFFRILILLEHSQFNSNLLCRDFLGGALASLSETLEGKWNDDIMWGCLVSRVEFLHTTLFLSC